MFSKTALRAMSSNNKSLHATKSVLVIGCGITGASTFHQLQKLCPSWSIQLWDKARGPGGRMSTTFDDGGASADLGAQYISVPKIPKSDPELLDKLLSDGILVPFEATSIKGDRHEQGQKHYVAPSGMCSVVDYFLQPAIKDKAVHFSRRVSRIDYSQNQWLVTDSELNKSYFDAVVSTVPLPQLLGLHPSGIDPSCDFVSSLLQKDNPDIYTKLSNVSYSTRYVAAVHYGPEVWDGVLKDTCSGDDGEVVGSENNSNWAVRYVNNEEDDALVFISIDNAKRNGGDVNEAAKTSILAGRGPSILLHSSVPWSIQKMKSSDSDHEIVARELLRRVTESKKLLPLRHGAFADSGAIVINVEKDRTEKVEKINPNPNTAPFVIAGDGLSGSNFDSCCFSGSSAAHLLYNWNFGTDVK